MKQKILILLLCSFISSATMSVGVQAADACEILDVSVEEQNSTEAFSQNDWEVRLSDEEILERYNLFLQRKSSMLSEEKTDAQSLLEEFADYAVDNKIIEDTPEARAAITKAVVRAEFKVVVTAGNVLAFNNVNYSAMGTKLNGVWSVYITFTDTYDFDYVAWKK